MAGLFSGPLKRIFEEQKSSAAEGGLASFAASVLRQCLSMLFVCFFKKIVLVRVLVACCCVCRLQSAVPSRLSIGRAWERKPRACACVIIAY